MKDAGYTKDMDKFNSINWCRLLVQDLRDAVRHWRSQKPGQTRSIKGCAAFLLVYYVDSLDHPQCPPVVNTPRVAYYSKVLVDSIVSADKINGSFGKLPFRSKAGTCYQLLESFSCPKNVDGQLGAVINLPKMSAVLSGSLSWLPTDKQQAVMDAMEKFDSIASQSAVAIAREHKIIENAYVEALNDINSLLNKQARDNNVVHVSADASHNSHDDVNNRTASPIQKNLETIMTHGSVEAAPYSHDDVNNCTTSPVHENLEATRTPSPPPQDGSLSPILLMSPARVEQTKSCSVDEHGVNHPVQQLNVDVAREPSKRIKRKPSRFVSPFKGKPKRPYPINEVALQARADIIGNPLLHSCNLMKSTRCQFTAKGDDIVASFDDGRLCEGQFVDFFIQCITHDEMVLRPSSDGYRLFLSWELNQLLNVEEFMPKNKYNHSKAIFMINECLAGKSIMDAKLIFLPMLHNQHWTVYCINLVHDRIDILDSLD